MPSLIVDTVRTDGVTLVELLVEAADPCRIRLERRFQGPIWPPRTGAPIAARLSDDPTIVDLDTGTTAIGFATPVELDEQPVELVSSEPLSPLPDGVGSWLDRIERRAATAERLCAVTDLRAAADAVAALGGLAAIETLAADIERDRRVASALTVVPDELCDRLEAIDIPVSAFARIARDAPGT